MKKREEISFLGYGGFILTFEPARTERVAEILAEYGEASESFSAEDWAFERCEFVFLIRRNPNLAIFAAALMARMRGSGGTRRVKMRLSDAVIFQDPISVHEANNSNGFVEKISTAEQLQRIDAQAWTALIDLVKKLRPLRAQDIDRLVAKRLEERRLLGDDNRMSRLTEQRDAVGLCLDIAGLDRRAILRSGNASRADSALSVLDLLDAQPVSERSLIERDARVFEAALAIGSVTGEFVGAAGRSVRTYVTDATPIETATGVDLLIFQEQYNSFLMLQYKGMQKDDVVRGWSYRVDGSNLDHQISTMKRIRSASPPPAGLTALRDLRLNDEPFYFKFCERTRPDASDDSLIAGITMSAPHIEHFLSLPEATQQGRGRRIGYENCPRYFNNSEFVTLARSGWIGCGAATTSLMAEILSVRERGRSAILAVIGGPSELRASDRGRRV
ncbi:hypothetical protein [Paraburkholderia agricolaris]|uniref:hypothetical protein n=1 Tax=Paraburkholderia agricolaris TaxID=2152888 RepID=UPI001291C633|nr:hypothetical protein [Paraburkholderia agricolaris]